MVLMVSYYIFYGLEKSHLVLYIKKKYYTKQISNNRTDINIFLYYITFGRRHAFLSYCITYLYLGMK